MSRPNPSEDFERFRSKIDSYLTRFYAQEAQRRDYTSSFYRKVHEEARDYSSNAGKRLRALLVMIGYVGYSHKDLDDSALEEIVPIAAAIELFHSFLLIHDDIVDNDDMRRGKPSMHRRIEGILPKGKTTSKDVSIIVGDLVLFHSLGAFLESKLPADRIIEAQRILVDSGTNTAIGEMYDLLDNNQSIENARFENVLFVMTYKTARYTIHMPLAIGSRLAGFNEDDEHFDELAKLLGVAFQLQDDYLGIFGSQERLGKPIKSDIEEGKKTLIMKWLYDECDVADKAFIHEHLGKPIDDETFARFKSLIVEKGIDARVTKYIGELVHDSREEVKKLRMNATGKAYLLSIIDALAGRES